MTGRSSDLAAHLLVLDLAADGTALGLRGDGLTVDGAAAENGSAGSEYESRSCGVDAVIHTSKPSGGDMLADLDLDPTACGTPRVLFADTAPGAPSHRFGAKFIVRGVNPMGIGESRDQWMGFGHTDLGHCPRLVFDRQFADLGSADARVTRIDDGSGARQWRVESQDGHQAICVRMDNRGDFVPTGHQYFLPFTIIITEVRTA